MEKAEGQDSASYILTYAGETQRTKKGAAVARSPQQPRAAPWESLP